MGDWDVVSHQSVTDAARPRNNEWDVVSQAPQYTSGGFATNAVNSAENFAKGIYGAVRHPLNTAENLGTALAGMTLQPGPAGTWTHDVAAPAAQAVGDFYKQRYGGLSNIAKTAYTDPVGLLGDLSTVASGAGGLLKGGAAIADAANAARVSSGLLAASDAANTAAKFTNPAGLLSVPGSLLTRRINIPSALNPVDGAAVDYALADPTLSGSVDAATASGNGYLQGTKAILQRSPLSSGIAGKAAQEQQAAIASKMGDIADTVSPGGARTRLTAGIATQGRISGALSAYAQDARQNFRDLLDAAESNPQQVQIGTRANPSLDPAAPNKIPVMASVAGPVSTSGVKTAAAPILDELEKTLPEAQRQASPSVSLLRQILNRPDVVDLETAIADNSALQNLARTETPQLRTQAQRIAGALVSPYRDAIDSAAQALGPDAMQALQNGRAATAAKYALGSAFPKNFRNNPAGFVRYLTSGDDVSYPALAAIQQHVPDALPDIARATLESIFKNATENGGVSKIDSTINKWNALGDKTKQVLFGPDVSQEVSNLMQYGKLATRNANPSGSATVGSAAALTAMLFKDPVTALAAMAGSRGLARKMFDPALAAKLRQTGTVSLVNPGPVAKTIGAVLNPSALNAAGAVNRGLLAQAPVPAATDGLLAAQ